MPNKFTRPTDPADTLAWDVLNGNAAAVEAAIAETPDLIRDKPVLDCAWSHGGRRCAAQDAVIECLWLIIENGARFEGLCVDTLDSAFKAFPRAAKLLFAHGADATAADGNGATALHLMAEIGYLSAAAALLDHGADAAAKNAAGVTALDIAKRRGHARTAKFLRDGEIPEAGTGSTVLWYRADRGYGYLRDPIGYGDLFFDAESVEGDIPASVEEGTKVSLEAKRDNFGLVAGKVTFQ